MVVGLMMIRGMIVMMMVIRTELEEGFGLVGWVGLGVVRVYCWGGEIPVVYISVARCRASRDLYDEYESGSDVDEVEKYLPYLYEKHSQDSKAIASL